MLYTSLCEDKPFSHLCEQFPLIVLVQLGRQPDAGWTHTWTIIIMGKSVLKICVNIPKCFQIQ